MRPWRTLAAMGLLALIALPAMAHEGGPLQPDDLWTAWELEPGAVIAAG